MDDFGKLFDTFKRSAFRFEQLQSYKVSAESTRLAKYISGEPVPLDLDNEWSDFVREAVGLGKSITRARFVKEPLSPYLKFELEWGYAPAIWAGENILIVTRRPDSESDFWLFDDETVAIMHYSEAGEFLRPEIHRGGAAIAKAVALREDLLREGTSYQEYMAGIRAR